MRRFGFKITVLICLCSATLLVRMERDVNKEPKYLDRIPNADLLLFPFYSFSFIYFCLFRGPVNTISPKLLAVEFQSLQDSKCP